MDRADFKWPNLANPPAGWSPTRARAVSEAPYADVTVTANDVDGQLFMHDDNDPDHNKFVALAVDSATAQHLARLANGRGQSLRQLKEVRAQALRFEQQRDSINADRAEELQATQEERDAAKQQVARERETNERLHAGLRTALAGGEPLDKVVNGLRRKVRTQAAEVTKLQELRRKSVTEQPEFKALQVEVNAQAQLTQRENNLRLNAEQALVSMRIMRDEAEQNLRDVRAANRELMEMNADLSSIRQHDVTEIGKLKDQLRDARAAAGWEARCLSETTAGGDGPGQRIVCVRANMHTGLHNSDTASGEGRQW